MSGQKSLPIFGAGELFVPYGTRVSLIRGDEVPGSERDDAAQSVARSIGIVSA